MTSIQLLKSTLEGIYLNKKIIIGASKHIFEVKSIEVSKCWEQLDIVFLSKKRDCGDGIIPADVDCAVFDENENLPEVCKEDKPSSPDIPAEFMMQL